MFNSSAFLQPRYKLLHIPSGIFIASSIEKNVLERLLVEEINWYQWVINEQLGTKYIKYLQEEFEIVSEDGM